VSNRVVLTVGDLVGIKPGGNPHRWYSPGDVQRMIDEIARDYAKLDPKDAAYFKRQQTRFETTGLAQYKRLIAEIKHSYHGVPVGASESIFAPLARALGLDLPRAGLVQVSMNVEDFEAAALHEIVERVEQEAVERGAVVVGSELVGLMPAGAAAAAAGKLLRIDGFDASHVLELRLLGS
jgi:ABC-type Zn uptake system ZnuABC Zn-binding protein ZnuA